MANELDLAVLAWSPLAGGVLTGKYSRADLEKQRQARGGGDVDPFDTSERMVALSEKKLALAELVGAIARSCERTPAQVAINWLMTRPKVIPIIGARSLAQAEDNLGGARLHAERSAARTARGGQSHRAGLPP